MGRRKKEEKKKKNVGKIILIVVLFILLIVGSYLGYSIAKNGGRTTRDFGYYFGARYGRIGKCRHH